MKPSIPALLPAAFALLAALAGRPAAAQRPAGAEGYAKEIAAGIQLFRKREYGGAGEHFRKARAMLPADWRGHAWTAMALVQEGLETTGDPKRRAALLRAGGRAASGLVKDAGLGFADPLFQYIRGVILAAQGDDTAALGLLQKAATHARHRYEPYRDIELQLNARRAYAQACTRIATRLIVIGEFEQADKQLVIADRNLPADDPDRHVLERKMAVVCEYLGRLEEAVQHLRNVIRLLPDNENVRYELTAAIAMIWIAAEQIEKGEQVLAELPEECQHTEVLVARAMRLYKLALRDPEDGIMDRALAYHREVMAKLADEDVYRLAEQFAEMVLEKVTRRNLEEHRALVEETLAMVEREQKRRPECPGLYFHLYRLYKLLGDAEKEVYYQALHDRKKKEWEHKEQYDYRGRPRCR